MGSSSRSRTPTSSRMSLSPTPPPFTETIARLRSVLPSMNGMMPSMPRSAPFFLSPTGWASISVESPPLELVRS